MYEYAITAGEGILLEHGITYDWVVQDMMFELPAGHVLLTERKPSDRVALANFH